MVRKASTSVNAYGIKIQARELRCLSALAGYFIIKEKKTTGIAEFLDTVAGRMFKTRRIYERLFYRLLTRGFLMQIEYNGRHSYCFSPLGIRVLELYVMAIGDIIKRVKVHPGTRINWRSLAISMDEIEKMSKNYRVVPERLQEAWNYSEHVKSINVVINPEDF